MRVFGDSCAIDSVAFDSVMQNRVMQHEIGHAPPRGLPKVPAEDADEQLSAIAGSPISLGENLVMSCGPASCPACGSSDVEDALGYMIDGLGKDGVHPIVWGDGYGLADTYVCRNCGAGWIEGVKPHPITWVRPWLT